ncbi:hypothetical protein NDU88_004556 [Pleurodeles waltl]|uniref:Uncharacterized protein n=1 Tax=Pleurodeles waltl TaxID=8319 RepID=A0AAV7UGG3_PLEWA|nr:hypothetical protein NDU88_004556 [Pleurodeles waltl]
MLPCAAYNDDEDGCTPAARVYMALPAALSQAAEVAGGVPGNPSRQAEEGLRAQPQRHHPYHSGPRTPTRISPHVCTLTRMLDESELAAAQ